MMCLEEQEKVDAFSAIAARWHDAGIGYGIVNGYLEDGGRLGRDLDLVMARHDLPQANQIALEVFEELSWRVRSDQRPWAWWLFAFKRQDGKVIGLEIDLLPRLQSGFNCIQKGVSPFTRPTGAHGWHVDPRGSLIKRVMLQIVAGNFNKFDRNPALLDLTPMEREVLERDPELGELLAETVRVKSTKDLRPLKARLKRRLYTRALRHPIRAIEAAIFGFSRNLNLNIFARQVCPVLSISSGKGIDVNQICEALSEKLQQATFLKPVVLKRAPRLLPPTNRLRMLRLLSGYWLEEKFVVNRKSVRLYPVLYANHPNHLLIDPQSYGVAKIPAWLPKRMPKASLSFVLVAAPATDSNEGNAPAYSPDQLKSMGLIDEVVSMKEGPEQAAERIFERILERFLMPEKPFQVAR